MPTVPSDPWLNADPTHDSPYWPYRKVQNQDTLAGAEQLPWILCNYLMDLPDGTGYEPKDDNSLPRTRLKKLIYWDDPLPLSKPLPTTEQMRSILYDPRFPANPPDPDRGYRIFPQNMVGQAQHTAQTLLRVYMARASALPSKGEFVTRQILIFDIITNYGLETNTGMTAASRSFDIVQCLKEACCGVNFGGVGPLTMQELTKIDDERTNVGYKLYCYIDFASSAPNPFFT